MRKTWLAGGILTGAVTSACGAGDAASDEQTDHLAIGLEEGSAQACAVLKLANTASFETLDDAAKLNRKAALAIFAVRAGDDGQEGTEDDGWFATLAELDAVK